MGLIFVRCITTPTRCSNITCSRRARWRGWMRSPNALYRRELLPLSSAYGFLPDPRRIWAWGIVFGGRFWDPATGRITADSEPIVRAAEWIESYGQRYGFEQVIRFRKADQALPGAAFPLLEHRYVLVMDGQWRVAELAAAVQAARDRGEPEPRFGVVPLPPPAGGLANAGWVNGNFFVLPRGGRNSRGAWEFMKFWNGFGGHAAEAARACAAGGWIPAGQEVIDTPEFQNYLRRFPLFKTFVDLAASPNQVPTPAVPGVQYFQDEISRAAEDALAGRLPVVRGDRGRHAARASASRGA